MQILSNNFVCEKEKSLKNHFWNLKFLYMTVMNTTCMDTSKQKIQWKKGNTVSSLTGWTIKINYFLFYVQLFLVSLRRCRVQIYEIWAIFPWRELARVLGSKLRDLRVKVIKTDWLEIVYNSCFFACPQLQLQQQQQKNNVGYCYRFFSISPATASMGTWAWHKTRV
jgi:hypothetical protein